MVSFVYRKSFDFDMSKKAWSPSIDKELNVMTMKILLVVFERRLLHHLKCPSIVSPTKTSRTFLSSL